MPGEDKCGCSQGRADNQGACDGKQTPPQDNLDDFLEQQALDERLHRIRHKVLVMSGKGGVGKSTVAANLAVALALAGKKVGLLDADIHGPSIPQILGLTETAAELKNGAIQPVRKAGLKIVSVGFFLSNPDEAVIWRGPRKTAILRQFLQDVEWGDLDCLVIDSPPGTGDEPLSVAQLAAPVDAAVIVTTPQDVAVSDVRKSITFCRSLNIPVLGVMENMSGFVCPKCGAQTDIFKTGGGQRLAEVMGVPFLGRIPIDPAVGEACDAGKPFVYFYGKTATARAFECVAGPVLALLNNTATNKQNKEIRQ